MSHVLVVVKRVAALVPTVLLATFVVFSLQHIVPGDPATAIAGEYATPERLAEIRAQLGLDQPFLTQYWEWLKDAATGDLGDSLLTGQSVWALIGERLGPTITIGVGAMLVSVLIGVPAGILAASRRGSKVDSLVSSAATFGIAVPNFFLGMVLVLVLALRLDWLPATGLPPFGDDPVQAIRHAIMPSLALGAVGAAEVARQLRSAMIEVLGSDFIRTHRAKGISESAVVWKHALKNAGLPLATIIGLLVNRVIGATVVVEAVFGISGLGSLVVSSTTQRDYPVIQGVVLITTLIVLGVNLLVDLGYRFIDPRVRS